MKRGHWMWAALAAAGLLAVDAAPAFAQDGDGYLITRPRSTFVIKGFYDAPRAEGEIYDFTTDLLTLDKGDFATGGFAAELAVRITERVDLALEWSYARSATLSEFRDFVEVTELGELPILQETSLRRNTFQLSGRFYPLSRGRQIGSLAWIPRDLLPYFGGGIGLLNYRLVQEGDFVNANTLDIFTDYLQSTESTLASHAFVGLEASLNPRFIVTAEGRYLWASAPTGGDFVDFGDIELTGFRASVGIGVRF